MTFAPYFASQSCSAPALPLRDFRPSEWRNRSSRCAIRGPVAIGALRASPRALAILCAGRVLADLSLVRSGRDFALIAFLGACAGIIGGLGKGPAHKQKDGEANLCENGIAK